MKRFISLLNIVLVLSMLLTACGPATTPEVIEKVVAETVVVEKEVEVTKEVQVEVEKEVVVTPTPTLVPPMPEEVPVIELDEALEDELSGDGAVAYYRVSGPEGYDRLIVELGGPGDADFDLYVRHGAPPSLDDYDWSSTGSGSEEQIIIDDPSGKYYILVYAYTGEGPYGIGAYVEDQPQPSR
ncbi:MAG: PPC domain-containing protein, partial [Anaerolineae bacterium]|nr:PPC domain-containing protein [Anaerolineae bacterium]